jgi:hypothetical protein
MNTDSALIAKALHALPTELSDGPAGDAMWVLSPATPGLLGQLQGLSAKAASHRSSPERNSIAAHANHVRYGLELLNRWVGGEENPFADADWLGSWKIQAVSAGEWKKMIEQLGQQAHAWAAAAGNPRKWDEVELTGAISSVAHMAYHLGAIRQLVLARVG